jgi:hypothetical protein
MLAILPRSLLVVKTGVTGLIVGHTLKSPGPVRYNVKPEVKMKQYHELIRILRKKCPLAYPIQVRRVKMEEFGWCEKRNRRFYIFINRKLGQNMAIETLIHEWSHALAWNHLHDKMDCDELDRRCHDAEWGVAYSKVYRIFEEHFLGAFKCQDSSNAA